MGALRGPRVLHVMVNPCSGRSAVTGMRGVCGTHEKARVWKALGIGNRGFVVCQRLGRCVAACDLWEPSDFGACGS